MQSTMYEQGPLCRYTAGLPAPVPKVPQVPGRHRIGGSFERLTPKMLIFFEKVLYIQKIVLPLYPDEGRYSSR